MADTPERYHGGDQLEEISVRKLVASLFGAMVLAIVGMIAVFFFGMRAKCPPVMNVVRTFNRKVTKAQAMKTAGQPGAYAAIITHVGRTSGTEYETPVGPFVTDEGFIIPLPYGTTADWVKNVLQAGTATIEFEGDTYEVDQPELIEAEEAIAVIPAAYQRSLRWFNVNDFLKVTLAES
jgi:deazaflavin-dependent oxidoreductase (nitroreductase family)